MHRFLNISILLVVFITFFNALVFFGLGIYQSILAYIAIIRQSNDSHPGILLVESLDRFLFGFVFIILSVGLSRLFLSDNTFFKNYDLPWLTITDFHQLKVLLLSALLVAMFVGWAPSAINHLQEIDKDWTVLLFPASLLLLAIATKTIKGLH